MMMSPRLSVGTFSRRQSTSSRAPSEDYSRRSVSPPVERPGRRSPGPGDRPGRRSPGRHSPGPGDRPGQRSPGPGDRLVPSLPLGSVPGASPENNSVQTGYTGLETPATTVSRTATGTPATPSQDRREEPPRMSPPPPALVHDRERLSSPPSHNVHVHTIDTRYSLEHNRGGSDVLVRELSPRITPREIMHMHAGGILTASPTEDRALDRGPLVPKAYGGVDTSAYPKPATARTQASPMRLSLTQSISIPKLPIEYLSIPRLLSPRPSMLLNSSVKDMMADTELKEQALAERQRLKELEEKIRGITPRQRCVCVCVYAFVYVCMHLCMYVCRGAFVFVCVYVFLCISCVCITSCIYLYIYMHACVYVYITCLRRR
jgi:hypothetical protein